MLKTLDSLLNPQTWALLEYMIFHHLRFVKWCILWDFRTYRAGFEFQTFLSDLLILRFLLCKVSTLLAQV